jgi:hypothetical protein
MSMLIKIHTRSVYGLLAIYVTDPQQAATIQRLTGRKTLSTDHISALQKLGLTFKLDSVDVPANAQAPAHVHLFLRQLAA